MKKRRGDRIIDDPFLVIQTCRHRVKAEIPSACADIDKFSALLRDVLEEFGCE